ncbi:MAG: hypothetical protein NC401_16995, partial [Ruminococcus sp.]|nr:hypothetical protein [Ruminococcus sp.]
EQFLYNQRRNVSGSLSATREKSWECFYNALCEVRRELREMGVFEKYERDFVDYALHSCLWNLNSLGEKAGIALYDKLKSEWFKELGIVDAPAEWFRFKDEYRQFCEIMSADNDYVAFKLARVNFENSEMKKQLAERVTVTQTTAPLDAQEAEFWRRELEATRDSLSFKVGRAVTWLPRKILRK